MGTVPIINRDSLHSQGHDRSATMGQYKFGGCFFVVEISMQRSILHVVILGVVLVN